MRTKLMLAGTLAFALVSAPAIFGRDREREVRTTTRHYERRTEHRTHRHYNNARNYRNDRNRVYRNGRYYRTEGLPPGLAKRDELPPGLQKHVRERGSLPPGLQKKVDRDDYYYSNGRGHRR